MNSVKPVEFTIPAAIFAKLEKAAYHTENCSFYNLVVGALGGLLVLMFLIITYVTYIHPRLRGYERLLINDELHGIYLYLFACISVLVIVHETQKNTPLAIHQQITIPYYAYWRDQYIHIDNLTKVTGTLQIPIHNVRHILIQQDYVGLLIAEKPAAVVHSNHLFILPKAFWQQVMKECGKFKNIESICNQNVWNPQ